MKSLKNEKGILALDFIFGLMIMTGFFMLVIMLNFTLSTIESIQYIAFATSRTYYAADENIVKSEDAALKKYDQLKKAGILESLLRNRWFEIKEPVFDDDRKIGGVRLDVTVKALSFTLPFFLGKTGEASSFKTNVNSYIGKEPSMQDCIEYNKAIKEEILNLDSSYQAYSSHMSSAHIIRTGDNGC